MESTGQKPEDLAKNLDPWSFSRFAKSPDFSTGLSTVDSGGATGAGRGSRSTARERAPRQGGTVAGVCHTVFVVEVLCRTDRSARKVESWNFGICSLVVSIIRLVLVLIPRTTIITPNIARRMITFRFLHRFRFLHLMIKIRFMTLRNRSDRTGPHFGGGFFAHDVTRPRLSTTAPGVPPYPQVCPQGRDSPAAPRPASTAGRAPPDPLSQASVILSL